jgi:hypothetical protein
MMAGLSACLLALTGYLRVATLTTSETSAATKDWIASSLRSSQ